VVSVQGFSVQSQQHDARYQGISVTIYYPIHPHFGKMMPVTRDFGGDGGGHWEIAIGEARQLIPKWMTDRGFCDRLTFGATPRSCLTALQELRRFLSGLTEPKPAAKLSCIVGRTATGERHEAASQTTSAGSLRSTAAQVRELGRTGEARGDRTPGQIADRRLRPCDGCQSKEDD